MESRGCKTKRIKTVLGDISFCRSHFRCPVCGLSRIPGDELLDVVNTGYSPGVRRLMARAGQRDTFKEGRDDLKEFAGILVTAKDVERISERMGEAVEAWQSKEHLSLLEESRSLDVPESIPVMYISYDGTGVPVVYRERAQRKGKQEDGSSRTREAKLGCVFTQTTRDPEGWPVRDEGSTTFIGAIEHAQNFGWRIYNEAVRRGLSAAKDVVVLADGARYNWDIAALHFPGCTEIIDLYHAREHLHDLCVILTPGGSRELINLETRWRTLMDEGKIEEIIQAAKRITPKKGEHRETALKEIGYFSNNAHRMRYADFRAKGYFVGSGVVEAGCKAVIGKRLKQSGMEWSVKGANAIIALRCCHLSGRMEDFWEQRTQQKP
jgi:hypothetical protein